jgi:hypothetical protein
MDALLVRGGEISRIKLSDDCEVSTTEMHNLIGNWFTICFRVAGLKRGETIDAYCDDEFLLREGIDWNVVLEGGTLNREPYPIGGPIVILGCVDRTGESRSLTEMEMGWFRINRGQGALFPVGERILFVPTLRLVR